ncbi:MAG: hypothetical protein MRQ09_00210 [Candidatus Midichloria sp.]|nr:hypothetical protein [Candidatus Midichloria sp.]
MSKVKTEVFGTLTLIGTIKAIIYGKYGLLYEDGELIQALVGSNLSTNEPLILCGEGSITPSLQCEVEGHIDCDELISPESTFCVYDDLARLIYVDELSPRFHCALVS